MQKLTGKTVLITGSTDGVGRLVARRLGEAGARVLVHGRDAARGAQIVSDIEQAGGAAIFLQADLASLAEVGCLAETALDATDRLDILINNAGIGTAGGVRQESTDGFELRFAVNYLAGFLLTWLLLPLLRASAPARIVNVSSAGQQAIDFADVMLTRGYSGATGRLSRCRLATRSPAGMPLIVRSMAKSSSMRRTASTASGAFLRSANSKNLRRPWLQHAASVIGPGLRLPS